MKQNINDYSNFLKAIQNDEIVYLFGAGISAALSNGKSCSWWQWIVNGIAYMQDTVLAASLQKSMTEDDSANNLIRVVGEVMKAVKKEGTYFRWMQESFESAFVVNASLSSTLRKMLITQDIFVTTNYDLLLEQATGLSSISYEEPNETFRMIDQRKNYAALHIHGIYDSVHGIDNIVADETQYDKILSDQGAQFIQNILGTRTLIFVGCGQTTEDGNISQFIQFAQKYLHMDQDYYFLYNSNQLPADMPDNIKLVSYGDSYNDLPDFMEDMIQARLRRFTEKNTIVGRTTYSEKKNCVDNFQKYHYSQETIPFCGRKKEIGELISFVNCDKRFTWWSITGQAGAGKSRLALELLKELPSPWYGFFVRDYFTDIDIESFVPFTDTVIVIDYVSGREKIVASLMRKFNERFQNTVYKLRILLIERENNRKTGSWFAKLKQRFGKMDDIEACEYLNHFLCIEDMDDRAVEEFIGSICSNSGVEADTKRDKFLRESYENKNEKLRYRPLFIQIFVEAWIANDFSIPRYDKFEELLRVLLTKEQEKWLASLDGEQNVSNSFIRLLLRANISELRTDNMPEYYKKDWDVINDYISSHSFPGKQRNEEQVSIINAVCHNINKDNYCIAPLFPDIIKEFMFFYYMEEDRLDDVMKEIWENAAHSFSMFIARCMADYPENTFYQKAINTYSHATHDEKTLMGRLELLKARKLTGADDPEVLYGIVENEHEFWRAISIDESSADSEGLSLIKVTGLNYVAKAYAGWSLYDVSNMIEVIEEALNVPGQETIQIMKQFFLQEHIKELSVAGFTKEASYLREKMNSLITTTKNEGWESMLDMQNRNVELMELIFSEDFENAYKVLVSMEHDCDYREMETVNMLAHSCFNFDNMAFEFGKTTCVGKGYEIVKKLELIFPDDLIIRARSIGCQVAILQNKFFADSIDEKSLLEEVENLEGDLSSIQFGDAKPDESWAIAWSMLKSLKINAISTNAEELNIVIQEATEILEKYPHFEEVATTKVIAVQVLHEKALRNRVSHDEVEELFAYVEDNYTSASLRNVFFEMLKKSEDSDNISNYMTERVVYGARQDARYNPIMGSGLSEFDEEADLLRVLSEFEPQKPYKRAHKKIGANDPCPCGSRKKFKKCCRGNGKYD